MFILFIFLKKCFFFKTRLDDVSTHDISDIGLSSSDYDYLKEQNSNIVLNESELHDGNQDSEVVHNFQSDRKLLESVDTTGHGSAIVNPPNPTSQQNVPMPNVQEKYK